MLLVPLVIRHVLDCIQEPVRDWLLVVDCAWDIEAHLESPRMLETPVDHRLNMDVKSHGQRYTWVMYDIFPWGVPAPRKPGVCWYSGCPDTGSLIMVPATGRMREQGCYCPVHAFDKWRPRKQVRLQSAFILRTWRDLRPVSLPAPAKVQLPVKIG